MVCWFYDINGIISYYFKDNNNQLILTLSVINKQYVNIIYYITYFGSVLYFDKIYNSYYKWNVESEPNIIAFLVYTKVY